MMNALLLATLVTMAPAQIGQVQQPGGGLQAATKVGPRYSAVMHGFSLCPPRGAERVHEPSVKRLVRWVRRDEKTGAVRWSLEALKNLHKPSDMPAAEYAKIVATELAKKEQFKISDVQVCVVAGRPAMRFRGVWSGAVQLWREQIWVPLRPQEHLVLDIAGRMEDKAKMSAALTASANTLRLFDPSAAIAKRSESFARGAEVLSKLNEKKLREVLAKKTQYFLVKLRGRTVGFMKVTEAMSDRTGVRGLCVTRSGSLKLPQQPRQMIHEDLFATADRSVELWRSATVVGKGASAIGPLVHEAVKQQNLLLVHGLQPGQARQTRQFIVPKAIRGGYLPTALAAVLPRLLDKSKPAGYAFAVYNVGAGDYHLRTVRVVGPEQLTLEDKKVAAIRLIDQMSQDAALVDVWVDQAGQLLQTRTSEGLITHRANSRAVVAAFAEELVELKKLQQK